MSRFTECLNHVLHAEGGYCDHSSDRGGKTQKGITQATYDEWRISQGLGRQPVIGISGDELRGIYRRRYWDVCRCDDLPKPVDYLVFDSAVNSGPRQAAKWLQRAVKAKDDGRIGTMTLKAVSSSDPVEICESILSQRQDFYQDIVDSNPSQSVFLKGWFNRLAHIREVALG